ncbi:flagellar hook-associated protein 1 FlgK [Palleronia salina]|uniref:Flagellar hook-associated protein 1 n=1 Tax=Palleronia salina TaxID=313368 RepID=A0A1M6D535_9RHOB|nr:flagellar hook-associated protein FlgK [Palleronia salina]SHI68213.1 flagellar hook-associated protein 1 FlgK [Palleronia salina]
MAISNALNNAISGLGAAGRSAQVVSSNFANALTPGYGKREVDLASRALTGGVTVAGVTRASDPALLSERRASDAAVASGDTTVTGLQRLTDAMGEPGAPQSIPGRVAALSGLLTEAASQPASQPRLNALADGARALAGSLNAASDTVQSVRLDADRSIAAQVDRLNTSLARVDTLNGDIMRARVQGNDVNGLLDARQAEIDSIAGIVPLRELPRPNGGVALITTGGALLLDDRPARVGFSPAGAMTPGDALGGSLSGLNINGLPVDMSRSSGRMSGGSLQAAFDLRDRTGVAAQAQLDGLARELIARVSASGVDPTIAAGSPGLFTDAGAAFAPANEVGLAGRVTLNAAVDPAQGGAVWRLRDGVGATAPGPQGDARLLNTLGAALGASQPAASAALGTGSFSLGGQADQVASSLGSSLFRAEQDRTFALSRSSELIARELEQGVDTDAELQTLLLVEQIYTANTKVIQAVDTMLQQLLEI